MIVGDARPASFRRVGRVDSLWWGRCAIIWAVVAVVLTSVGLTAVQFADLREGYDPVVGVPPDTVPGIWARWDSSYYIAIAREGYENNLYAVGFFPLYPLTFAFVSRLTGWSLAVAGMIVSLLSYLAAILMLNRLAYLMRNDDGYALRSVLYLALFPTSFFSWRYTPRRRHLPFQYRVRISRCVAAGFWQDSLSGWLASVHSNSDNPGSSVPWAH